VAGCNLSRIAWIGLRDAVCLVYEVLGAWLQLWMSIKYGLHSHRHGSPGPINGEADQ